MANDNFKYLVFIGVILIILAFIGLFIMDTNTALGITFFVILIAILIFIKVKFDVVVELRDYERAVIFRFGKLNRVAGPGWAIIFPTIESFERVDLRIMTIDVPSQDVITKDSIEVTIDAVIYLKVKKDEQSVINSIIEVEDYKGAAKLFIVSSLRDVIGSMLLTDVISSVEVVNAKMKENLEKISSGWGITIDSVEMKDVQIPEIILKAMHEEKAAVQEKLARGQRADAHKLEIEAVKEAAAKLDDKAIAYYYIKAIETMSSNPGSKIFFPADFTKLAASIAGFADASKVNPSDQQKLKGLLDKYITIRTQALRKKSILKSNTLKKAKKNLKKSKTKNLKKKR